MWARMRRCSVKQTLPRGGISPSTTHLTSLAASQQQTLVIEVYQDDKLAQTSDVIFNAPPVATRNFIIPVAKAPELQQLTDKIMPLLRNKIKIAGLGRLR